jgi:hypothetical protein
MGLRKKDGSLVRTFGDVGGFADGLVVTKGKAIVELIGGKGRGREEREKGKIKERLRKRERERESKRDTQRERERIWRAVQCSLLTRVFSAHALP